MSLGRFPKPWGRIAAVLLALLAVLFVAHGGLAETQTAAPPSAFDGILSWAIAQQRAFHRDLVQAIRALSGEAGVKAGLWLAGASFVYGVFHAAGPGHGKAVLSAYLLTHRARLARGVGIGVAASFCQGLSAIVIVYGLIGLVGWRSPDTAMAVSWAERVSYMLLMAMGAFLALRASFLLADRIRHAGASSGSADHDHDPDCGCGCAHAPSSGQIARAEGWRTVLGLILSIGLRPCSGAVLVLIFAYTVKIAWAGVAAVLAMSAGTALTVAALALLSVKARDWAVSFTGGGGRKGALLGGALALCGGLVIASAGLFLLIYSFSPAHPLGVF
ncbi:MAG: nickel/cobalt transporter [Rhodospirillaceae bacterium]|nr:nickel/cobalt transporter [Rhodospirillaceae bacterium]